MCQRALSCGWTGPVSREASLNERLGESFFLFEQRSGVKTSFRSWLSGRSFLFRRFSGAPSRMGAAPASQFMGGPSGGQKAAGGAEMELPDDGRLPALASVRRPGRHFR